MNALGKRTLSGFLKFFMLAYIAFHTTGCVSLSREDLASVAGKTYVITGASSGIGRGVALKLGSLQANVVVAARRTRALENLAEQIRAAGGHALVVTTDVSQPEDIELLAKQTVAQFGNIDVWINNAGVGAIGRFEAIPIEDHSRLIDINLKGAIYGSHAAIHQFQAQGYGTLVNVGSVESEVPLAYQATYAASKAAVLSLGRALNEELRLGGYDKISVATVLPWATDTPFFDSSANYSGGKARAIAMDSPDKVVDAIIHVSLHPQEELPVGWKGKIAYHSHRFLPNLSERLSANIYHKIQIENAPPAPPTTGNLYRPGISPPSIKGGNQ